MKKLFLGLVCSLVLFSCKTKSIIQETKNTENKTIIEKPTHHFFSEVSKKSAFQSVKISSKINVENGSFVPTADAVIYIENDKKIWMNISAMFFNVARGIATPQGVKAYEKIGKTYVDSNFEYLNKLLNINFINYHSLQNMLVGKPVFSISEADFSLLPTTQGFRLLSNKNQKIVVDNSVNEYAIAMDFSPTMNLEKIEVKDVKSSDNFEINYSNWEQFSSEKFPKNVKIIIKGKKNSQILIENTKFEFLKMETPYAVPNNYTKKEF